MTSAIVPYCQLLGGRGFSTASRGCSPLAGAPVRSLPLAGMQLIEIIDAPPRPVMMKVSSRANWLRLFLRNRAYEEPPTLLSDPFQVA
jgi:hypothetical protein